MIADDLKNARVRAKATIRDGLLTAMKQFHADTGLHIIGVEMQILRHETKALSGLHIDQSLPHNITITTNADL